MKNFIAFILGNFTLTFLVIGFVFSLVVLSLKKKPLDKPLVIEALFFYFLLFSIGLSFLYNFIFHIFFAEMAASFIGWKIVRFNMKWVMPAWLCYCRDYCI